MTNWGGEFKSLETRQGTPAPKHLFLPAMLQDSHISYKAQGRRRRRGHPRGKAVAVSNSKHSVSSLLKGFLSFLNLKLLFLQYHTLPDRLCRLPCLDLCAATATQVGADHHLLRDVGAGGKAEVRNLSLATHTP